MKTAKWERAGIWASCPTYQDNLLSGNEETLNKKYLASTVLKLFPCPSSHYETQGQALKWQCKFRAICGGMSFESWVTPRSKMWHGIPSINILFPKHSSSTMYALSIKQDAGTVWLSKGMCFSWTQMLRKSSTMAQICITCLRSTHSGFAWADLFQRPCHSIPLLLICHAMTWKGALFLQPLSLTYAKLTFILQVSSNKIKDIIKEMMENVVVSNPDLSP